MSIQNDVKTSQNDFRTISTLLGDSLSQFAKLFQNEVDLAKAELGEKGQHVVGALSTFAVADAVQRRMIGQVLDDREIEVAGTRTARTSTRSGPLRWN